MVADGALLEARAICAWRGERQVLRNVSFALRPGEFLQVLGPNGAGKSTLLRVLCGLLPPESGEVHWRGATLATGRPAFCSELLYLGHLNAIKPDLTALENLRYLAGLRTRLTARECRGALERVGLGHSVEIVARALSAGQKRRLALARLTLERATVWILDEPVTHLDAEGVVTVEALLRAHLSQGGMVVAAAHQKLLATEPRMRALELRA
jgi:heme exporter protein A